MTQVTRLGSDMQSAVNEPALGAARSPAVAIGQSEVFLRFEAAHDAFANDETAQARFRTYRSREQELRVAAMWGGAGGDEEIALQREWQDLSTLRVLRDYLEAADAVGEMFRAIAARISESIGMDYGAACSPAGGCC